MHNIKTGARAGNEEKSGFTEIIQQNSFGKFSRKCDIFLLDLTNEKNLRFLTTQEIIKDLINLCKIGLHSCESLVIILPNVLKITEFAEIFDSLFLEEPILTYFL